MVNKHILLLLLIFFAGCEKKVTPPAVDVNDLVVAESQNILWYNTASSLRKSVEPSWKIDVAIVSNYFPLYLTQRKHGLNKQQFSMVVAAYRSLGRAQAESLVWNMPEKEYTDFWLPGPLSSCGFNLDENDTFKKFRKHRSEYFEELETFKGKSSFQGAGETSTTDNTEK